MFSGTGAYGNRCTRSHRCPVRLPLAAADPRSASPSSVTAALVLQKVARETSTGTGRLRPHREKGVLVEFADQCLVGVQAVHLSDQAQAGAGIDAPIRVFVGVSEGRAANRFVEVGMGEFGVGQRDRPRSRAGCRDPWVVSERHGLILFAAAPGVHQTIHSGCLGEALGISTDTRYQTRS